MSYSFLSGQVRIPRKLYKPHQPKKPVSIMGKPSQPHIPIFPVADAASKIAPIITRATLSNPPTLVENIVISP